MWGMGYDQKECPGLGAERTRAGGIAHSGAAPNTHTYTHTHAYAHTLTTGEVTCDSLMHTSSPLTHPSPLPAQTWLPIATTKNPGPHPLQILHLYDQIQDQQ